MTEPQQEFNALDELFRKTFQNMPDTPAANGWDTPSDKVWQHVQHNMPRPASAWSAKTIGLLSAFAVVLAFGLFMLFQPKPAAPTTLPQPNQPSTPSEMAPAPVNEKPETQPLAQPESAKTPKPKQNKPQNTAAEPVNSSQQQPSEKPKPGSAQPLPGSNSDSRNSKEAQKNGGRQ